MRPGSIDIGEDARWAAENIVFQFNAFVNGNIILYTDPVANLHVITNIHILSKRAVTANDGTLLDM